MEKKRAISIPTIVLFAAAAVLLLFSTIGIARAALVSTETYDAELKMQSMGITLLENGSSVSSGLLTSLTDEKPVPGKKYEEKLSVTNNGAIDAYVRLTIRRYWTDADGKKLTDLTPDMIELNILEDSGWIADPNFTTDERMVFYYAAPVAAGGSTKDLSDTISVAPSAAVAVSYDQVSVTGGTKTVTTYLYNNAQLCLEVEADGVQARNGADAIQSAWGVSVSVSGDGTLSLN